jgi:hypothetical protein
MRVQNSPTGAIRLGETRMHPKVRQHFGNIDDEANRSNRPTGVPKKTARLNLGINIKLSSGVANLWTICAVSLLAP